MPATIIRKRLPGVKGWVPRTFEETREAFLSAIVKDPSGCWWYPTCFDGDYGRVFWNGKRHKAHRFSWMVHRGDIPEDFQVLHFCDHPACVNPDHLFLGKHADNMSDMVSKGRSARLSNEHNPNARYSNAEVLEMHRIKSELGLNARQIALMLGANWNSVRKILSGNSWQKL